MSQKRPISGVVSEDVHQRVDKLAERLGWTRSELVAHCIEYGLREGEKCADKLASPLLGNILRLIFTMDTSDPEAIKAIEQAQRNIREHDKLQRRLGKVGEGA